MFIIETVILIVLVSFLLFLPGWSLLLAIFGKKNVLTTLEKFVASFGLGLISLDFIFFLYSKLGILIHKTSASLGIGIFILVCLGIYRFRFREEKVSPSEAGLFNFSRKETILILLLLFLTFFIKTVYLSGTVLPTATDMGHHMYWSKEMAETGKLPTYDGMPDFIIGEHIIFGTIAILGNLDFFGAFPVLVLYLFNLLGILAVFILALRIFGKRKPAILSLLFLGVFYAVSSPQGKFVSGGVVGNTFGNYLLPLAFYFYFRAFEHIGQESSAKENLPISKLFLALAVFVTFGIFYTHHLTGFVFLFIFPIAILIYLAVNFENVKGISKRALRLIFSPQVLGIFILGLIFFFFVFTPNYVKGSAVQTAVGAPSKDTRAGLSLMNLESAIGPLQLGLGLMGLLFLGFSWKRKNFGLAIMAAWMLMVLLMSIEPDILFINLPSARIGNYLSFPAAILAAYAFSFVFSLGEASGADKKGYSKPLPGFLLKFGFLVLLGGSFFFGVSDSVSSFKNPDGSSALFEVFDSSRYLASRTGSGDMILKDHNYLTGDSWIKLFFMRGYRYPLSRSYFKRYEDATNPREMCTLYMISNPASPDAEKCFSETQTDFIMVDPLYDSAQFERLNNFDQVYESSSVGVFYRK